METVTPNPLRVGSESSIDTGTEPEVVATSQESVPGADQSDHIEAQSMLEASSASIPSDVDKTPENRDAAVEMQLVTSPVASETEQDHNGPDDSVPVMTKLPPLAADQKSAGLWAAAYAFLQEEDPDLVREFEKTVSRWLISRETTTFRPLHRTSTIGMYRNHLKGPLRAVISKVFEDLEAPQEPATDSWDTTESEADEDGDEVSLEETLRGALQSSPHASLAWAASYITFQVTPPCICALLPLVKHEPVTHAC